MSNSPAKPPSPEEALRLYQRHLEKDPVAPTDLAEAFLEPLIAWLGESNPRLPPEIHEDAAADAILALIHHPQSFVPERLSLEVYLRMSAQGDLRNLLARERKHSQRRVSLEAVEHSLDAGKYLGKADDPSLPLQIEEQVRLTADAVPASVREGLSDQELQVLELMLRKERKTAVYAQACGLQHLPAKEQRKQVKRLKDKITKRLERAGGADDQAPGQAGPAGNE